MPDVRDELLKAGARLFAEHGYQATGVQDIAGAAGVNKAMLYYYFNSKDGLYDQLVGRGISAIAGAVAAAEKPGLALPERIRQLISSYLSVVVKQPEIARIIYREALGAGERARPVVVEHFTQTIKQVSYLLEIAKVEGAVLTGDTTLAAYSLFGMANMFISSHFVTGRALDVPALTEHITELFLHGISGGEA